MSMIYIKKSKTADTRTCDWSKVNKGTLLDSSNQHIEDVEKGLKFFSDLLQKAAVEHDLDKITKIDWFYQDFVSGFKTPGWWDNHRKINRHHLDHPDGIPEDVNLLDVLEHIVDCVMAGMGRVGKVYPLKLNDELLQKAFNNTVKLLQYNVEVEQ